jgi:hypothetical protein
MLAGAGYLAHTWFRYGHASRSSRSQLLDRFMPEYEVVERHAIKVAAPAPITYAAACDMDLEKSVLVRGIFRGRELLMRASSTDEEPTRGALLSQLLWLGWGILAESPGRELVLGAVTRPWEPNVVFHALPPADFAAFDRPGYVRIAFNLSVQPLGPESSMFRTETRAAATDPEARKRFRRYWTVMSAGIGLIRRASLHIVRNDAQRRYRLQPVAADRSPEQRGMR